MSIRHLLLGLAALFIAVPVALMVGHPTQATAGTRSAAVEHGRYLVGILGCNDCHTPLKMGEHGPEPDLTRMLSGHPQELKMPPAPRLPAGPWMYVGSATNTAFAGPWGVTYAPNLTPDTKSGMGIWTEEQFVQTLRSGKHWGVARPIQPPMPWQAYRNLTDADISAIFEYLRSVPAVSNLVPAYEPPSNGDE